MRYRFLRFPEGKFKAVTFSYDDGLHADIRLAKVLADHGMKGTFNLCSGLMSKLSGQHYLSSDEIREYILPFGHEIAIHGHNHSAPGLCRPVEIVNEFLTCREKLEGEFGKIIRGMAYPDSGIKVVNGGKDAEDIKNILRSLDIAYARTTLDDRSFAIPNDFMCWSATAHHTDPNIMKIIDEFVSLDENKLYCSRRWSKVCFIWGHSAEFDNNKNWHLLDEICDKLAKKDDTWYATNMEIYEYVKAYESLIYSSDGSKIFNPTLQTIWFNQDGKLYEIHSGETLCI